MISYKAWSNENKYKLVFDVKKKTKIQSKRFTAI